MKQNNCINVLANNGIAQSPKKKNDKKENKRKNQN